MGRDDSLRDFSALSTVLLAHDLQNLLAIMAGCVDSLVSRSLGIVRADRDIAELDEALDSAFQLSRELLAVVGLQQTQERLVIDVHDLIERYRGMIERLLGANVNLAVSRAAAVSLVEATAVQLEWMLLNLAANGRDAMPNGGTLHIETSSVDRWVGPRDSPIRAGRYLRLTVRDEGQGIDQEMQARLFEPHFTTRAMGTGLGLTSVAVTVRTLKGWLYVDSPEKGGTSVHVLLPLFAGRVSGSES
jgi:signal transduction histidine kinase